MMLHPVVMTAALLLIVAAFGLGLTGGPAAPVAGIAAALVAALAAERAVAGLKAARQFRSATPLLFPVFHLIRDAAWVAALAAWSVRRLTGRSGLPSHSMRPRPAERGIPDSDVPTRILGVIPVHNEAATLEGVVADVRASHPDLDVLVIDDGSTDETPDVIERLGIRWLRLPERLGVGSAVRAGLRYASRRGYDAAVRLDGDGQHRACDISRVLAPLLDGRADVVLGSRYTTSHAEMPLAVRLAQRFLSFCLSALTGRRVTDATSGFCALGRRAVRLLAEHHPTGYPEPELRLLLERNGLRVVVVPIQVRSRQGGRTSLTPFRMTAAGARFLLAMIIVPFRSGLGSFERD
jgi:hypothetical protein